MRIEKSQAFILKVQINNDDETPIVSGVYYIKLKRNSDDLYWDGSTYTATDGDYLTLTHDILGVWEYSIPATALTQEGQYTAFFNNEANPKIYTSLDLKVLRTVNYWTATAH